MMRDSSTALMQTPQRGRDRDPQGRQTRVVRLSRGTAKKYQALRTDEMFEEQLQLAETAATRFSDTRSGNREFRG
jgi:hypothetical protein